MVCLDSAIECGLLYGTAQFKLTHACRHTSVLALLTRAKLKKLACARTVARDFGARDSKHTRHTIDARHVLALGLPRVV